MRNPHVLGQVTHKLRKRTHKLVEEWCIQISYLPLDG